MDMPCTAPITPSSLDYYLSTTITKPHLQAIAINLVTSFGRISFCAVYCPPGHNQWRNFAAFSVLWAAALLLEVIRMHTIAPGVADGPALVGTLWCLLSPAQLCRFWPLGDHAFSLDQWSPSDCHWFCCV